MSEEQNEGVRIVVDREKYVTGQSGAGSTTLHNGDPVATALNGLLLEEVQALAAKLGVEYPDYTHLNVGMQRMNIGNRIRGHVRQLNGEKEGSGDAALAKNVKPFQTAAAKRAAAVAKEKAAAEKERAAKAAAKAQATKAANAAKTAKKAKRDAA